MGRQGPSPRERLSLERVLNKDTHLHTDKDMRL